MDRDWSWTTLALVGAGVAISSLIGLRWYRGRGRAQHHSNALTTATTSNNASARSGSAARSASQERDRHRNSISSNSTSEVSSIESASPVFVEAILALIILVGACLVVVEPHMLVLVMIVLWWILRVIASQPALLVYARRRGDISSKTNASSVHGHRRSRIESSHVSTSPTRSLSSSPETHNALDHSIGGALKQQQQQTSTFWCVKPVTGQVGLIVNDLPVTETIIKFPLADVERAIWKYLSEVESVEVQMVDVHRIDEHTVQRRRRILISNKVPFLLRGVLGGDPVEFDERSIVSTQAGAMELRMQTSNVTFSESLGRVVEDAIYRPHAERPDRWTLLRRKGYIASSWSGPMRDAVEAFVKREFVTKNTAAVRALETYLKGKSRERSASASPLPPSM